MAQQYQDMVVDEADGKARYDLVDRGGNVVASGVALELASPVVREGDDWGALEANLLLTKDGGAPAPRTDNPHKVTAAQAGAYTRAETDGKLAGKANSGHTHDERYYTEGEVNNLLAGKAPSAHTHDDRYFTESEVTAKLNGKANTAGTYAGLTVGAAQKLTGILPVDRGGTGRAMQCLGFYSWIGSPDANGRFVIEGLSNGLVLAVGSVGNTAVGNSKHCVSFESPDRAGAGRIIGNVFEASTGLPVTGYDVRVNIIYFNF